VWVNSGAILAYIGAMHASEDADMRHQALSGRA
jgi:hypothetical protein